MNKYVVLIFIFISFFYGCSNRNKTIERKEFVKILSELYIAEALSAKKDTNISIQKDYYKSYQLDIFKKYKVDEKRYQSSFDFYNKDLIDMQKIYDEAINRLSEAQAKGLL